MLRICKHTYFTSQGVTYFRFIKLNERNHLSQAFMDDNTDSITPVSDTFCPGQGTRHDSYGY